MCTCVCAQSCLTLWGSMDCSPPGSSVHGILQARILEWVAISFSRDWTWVSHIEGRLFPAWSTRESLWTPSKLPLLLSFGCKREAVGLYPPHLLWVPSPGQTADSSPRSGFSHCRLCSHKTPPTHRAPPWILQSNLGPRRCHPEAKGRTMILPAPSIMIFITRIHPPNRHSSEACVPEIPKKL